MREALKVSDPDRRLPQDAASVRILEERARHIARAKDTGNDIERTPYLKFALGGGLFGITFQWLEEVMPVADITRVPCTPPVIAGVTNYRGELLPVIDLKNLIFGDISEASGLTAARVLVVKNGGRQLGLLVESIEDNDDYSPDEFAPGPRLNELKNYVAGVHMGLVAILAVDALLAEPALVVEESVE